MVARRQGRFETPLVFGGGLNTRVPVDQVNERECTLGENFSLDIDDKDLRVRKPFDLKGVAPNGQEIRGFAQLQDRDNKVTTLIQAGPKVYKWDGSTFTEVGEVNAKSRLRGPLTANWLLDDLVVITDLALLTPVMQWDGYNLEFVDFGLENAFYAKYALSTRERVLFANVRSGTHTPHVIAGTELEKHNVVSTTKRPGTGAGSTSGAFFGEPNVTVGEADPWFLPVPDMRPINGLVEAFDEEIITSTEKGRLFRLQGENAQEFRMKPLFARSFASGDEAIIFTGNDVIFGRPGHIESLVGTINFGDVELDDPSRFIAPTIEGVDEWTVNYDSRRQKIYAWPKNGGSVWVANKSIEGASPWAPYTTAHPSNYEQTCAWTMLDPTTGKEGVFWGDRNGNIYMNDGVGQGDGGTTEVTTKWVSRLITIPQHLLAKALDGWIRFVPVGYPVDLKVTLLWGGTRPRVGPEQTISVTVPDDADFYNGSNNSARYFGGGKHFGSYNSFVRKKIDTTGSSEEFRVQITATTDRPFEVNGAAFVVEASS